MPVSEIKPGLRGHSRIVVTRLDLASAYGNTGVDVMSSMTLMTLLEQAAIRALERHLGSQEMTVGTHMELDHLAPTPRGLHRHGQRRADRGGRTQTSLQAHGQRRRGHRG